MSGGPVPGTTRGTLAAEAVSADEGGALLAMCIGHRCAALHRLQEVGDARQGSSSPAAEGAGPEMTSLRGAVRGRRGAVMVLSECMGACAMAQSVLWATASREVLAARP